MNPKKNIIKNYYDKIALDNAQKTAVFLRRVEYSTNMRKNNNQNKKITQDYLKKVIIIQKWWKTIYLIIFIQKYIRGYLSRTKLIESLEKQEFFINILFNIHYLYSKIFFRRFIKRLIIYDESFLSRKMIHIFFIINVSRFVRKWKENCDKINNHNKNFNNLKNSFYNWKKTIDKFSFLKSILKNYKITKSKNNINHQNIVKKNPSNKELNKNKSDKRKIENKEIGKEETKKSKKTLVFCFRKKNQVHDKKKETIDETEITNFINESYKMMLYQNKKNSTRNLNTNLFKKKFDEHVKNIINKNNNHTSRETKINTEISNKNEMNKNNSKMDIICKTDTRIKTTKKRINEILGDKHEKNKKVENENNKKEIIMNNNITPNKENHSKEYVNNIILVSPNPTSSKTKTENLSSDNKNINIIIDSPFQNILNENTQGAIKNKDDILNIEQFSIKDIEEFTKNDAKFNKLLDNDKLIPFDSIDNDNDDNLNDIITLNKNDETNANSDTNNNNENNDENYDNQIENKKIKELVITFDKKPLNNLLNINQDFEETNNKIENKNQLNNINEKYDNIILNKTVNISDNIIEKENITNNDNKLNDKINNKNKEELKYKEEKFDTPTLIKKNNIFQTKIQFQKPTTQNILELNQNNNTNDNYNNDINNYKNKNDNLDNDIDILNINEEIENIAKFKPPSKIKEIVIENLNLNKNDDQRNDDFYTGYYNYNNNYTEDDERVLRPNHSLGNLTTGTDFFIDNLNQTQNYNNYTPINERYIKFTQNPNNEVLGYPLPIDYNNYHNNINNNQIIDNYNSKDLVHKKTYSSNNLFQYKYPQISRNIFSKKIIPNSEVSLHYSNSNSNLRENQNINKYNNISNLYSNNNKINQNNLGNIIYMKRVNICPPKNLNKTYVHHQSVNQKIN